MKINDYKLFYSVGTHIAFDNWAVNNQKASYTEGIIMKFLLMCESYNSAVKSGFLEGKEQTVPKKEDIAMMPNAYFEEISKMVAACEKRDTTRQVEEEPIKGKNGKSAAK